MSGHVRVPRSGNGEGLPQHDGAPEGSGAPSRRASKRSVSYPFDTMLSMKSDNLILVKDISATDAGRRFSEMLDAVEHDGESFTIVRHGRPVAKLAPVIPASGTRLKSVLRDVGPDDRFAAEVAEARSLLTADETPWPN